MSEINWEKQNLWNTHTHTVRKYQESVSQVTTLYERHSKSLLPLLTDSIGRDSGVFAWLQLRLLIHFCNHVTIHHQFSRLPTTSREVCTEEELARVLQTFTKKKKKRFPYPLSSWGHWTCCCDLEEIPPRPRMRQPGWLRAFTGVFLFIHYVPNWCSSILAGHPELFSHSQSLLGLQTLSADRQGALIGLGHQRSRHMRFHHSVIPVYLSESVWLANTSTSLHGDRLAGLTL